MGSEVQLEVGRFMSWSWRSLSWGWEDMGSKAQSEVGGEQLINFWLEERGWGFLYQLWRGNDWVQRDDLLHASAGHALFGHSAIRRVV